MTSPAVNRLRLRLHLRTQISTCRNCPLPSTCTAPVPPSIPTTIRPALLCIGEAPGYQEDRRGEPFVGVAGELLDKWLIRYLHLKRAQVMVGNTVSCRPPKNRQPRKKEIEACTPNLAGLIHLYQMMGGKFVLLLGGVALRSLRPSDTVGRHHGRLFYRCGLYFLPTYHPAAILRDGSYAAIVDEDLRYMRKVMREWHGGGIESHRMKCECGREGWRFDAEGVIWCRGHWRSGVVARVEQALPGGEGRGLQTSLDVG